MFAAELTYSEKTKIIVLATREISQLEKDAPYSKEIAELESIIMKLSK